VQLSALKLVFSEQEDFQSFAAAVFGH
jgi:hypothetical protein